MAGNVITIKLKSMRLDRARVKRAERRMVWSSTKKGLAFIKTKASRKYLRRGKKSSRPGKPPKVHSKSKHISLKFILFEFDQSQNAGFVGPVKLTKTKGIGSKAANAVPGTLERGGAVTYIEQLVETRQESFWMVVNRKSLARAKQLGRKIRRRRVRVAKRAYMVPATEEVADEGKLLEPWHNSFGS
jgi:hypothetical protein